MLTPLNPGPTHLFRAGPAAAPEFWPTAIAGRLFVLDAMTLDVYRMTPGLLREVLASPVEIMGLRQSPAFSPPSSAPTPCMYLILNLTHACNLACSYCFVRERQASRPRSAESVMSLDLAKAAVTALYPDRAKPMRLGFFGGEPLVAWPILRQVVEWAETEYQDSRFSVTTNGTLIDDEKAEWFGKRRGRFSFIVSLDGSRDRHDELRPFATGGGSYASAMNGLERLCARGFRPTLRSTFTERGLDLVGELEALNELCDRGLGGHVSIEPVSLTESCNFAEHAIDADCMHGLEPMYMHAADWFIDRAREGKRARFHHLGKMLERLLQKTPQPSECGAGKGYLTVSPSGEIHACHREKSPVGRFEQDARSAIGANGHMGLYAGAWHLEWLPAREVWRDNRLDARQKCPSCPLRWLCGGGCRQDSLDESADVRIPDRVGCELTKIRFRMAVKVLDAIGPEASARAIGIQYGASARPRPRLVRPKVQVPDLAAAAKE